MSDHAQPASTYLVCKNSGAETSAGSAPACYPKNRKPARRSNAWTTGELMAAERLRRDYEHAENRHIADADAMLPELGRGNDGLDEATAEGVFDGLIPDDATPEVLHWSVAEATPADVIRLSFPDHRAIQRRALKRALVPVDIRCALAAVDAVAAGWGKPLARYIRGLVTVPMLATAIGFGEDTVRARLKEAIRALNAHYSAIARMTIILPPPGARFPHTGPSAIGRTGPLLIRAPVPAPRAPLIQGLRHVTTPDEAAAFGRSQFTTAPAYLNNVLRFSDLRGWPAKAATVGGVPAVALMAGIADKPTKIANTARALREAGLISEAPKLPASELAMLLLGVLWDEAEVNAAGAAQKLADAISVDADGNPTGSKLGADLATVFADAKTFAVEWFILEPAGGCAWLNLTIDGQQVTLWYWTADDRESVAERRKIIVARNAVPDRWQTAAATACVSAEPSHATVPGAIIRAWARRAVIAA